MIKITPFKDLYPGDPLGRPAMRARLLASAGSDYYNLCKYLHGNGPISSSRFSILIPAMQQAIELLVKSVAFKAVPAFNPRTHSHKTLAIIDSHSAVVPLFGILARSDVDRALVTQLTAGYAAVRYGEAHVAFDRSTWEAFSKLAEQLLAEASLDTNERQSRTV